MWTNFGELEEGNVTLYTAPDTLYLNKMFKPTLQNGAMDNVLDFRSVSLSGTVVAFVSLTGLSVVVSANYALLEYPATELFVFVFTLLLLLLFFGSTQNFIIIFRQHTNCMSSLSIEKSMAVI